MTAPTLVLNLTVLTEDEAIAVKAWEVLGRAAVGLALDGVQVSTSITTVDEQPEETT